MRSAHHDPYSTRAGRPRPPARLAGAVASALAPLLLASCSDSLSGQTARRLAARPDRGGRLEPVRGSGGQAAVPLALRVVKTYQRTEAPRASLPTRGGLRVAVTSPEGVGLRRGITSDGTNVRNDDDR